jgi:hypothetical protein
MSRIHRLPFQKCKIPGLTNFKYSIPGLTLLREPPTTVQIRIWPAFRNYALGLYSCGFYLGQHLGVGTRDLITKFGIATCFLEENVEFCHFKTANLDSSENHRHGMPPEDWAAAMDFADQQLRGMKVDRKFDQFPAETSPP